MLASDRPCSCHMPLVFIRNWGFSGQGSFALLSPKKLPRCFLPELTLRYPFPLLVYRTVIVWTAGSWSDEEAGLGLWLVCLFIFFSWVKSGLGSTWKEKKNNPCSYCLSLEMKVQRWCERLANLVPYASALRISILDVVFSFLWRILVLFSCNYEVSANNFGTAFAIRLSAWLCFWTSVSISDTSLSTRAHPRTS